MLREEGLGISERLIEHYRDVLTYLDPRFAPADGARALELVRETVERAGGFESEFEDIESVAVSSSEQLHAASRQIGRDRATMLSFARTVELELSALRSS